MTVSLNLNDYLAHVIELGSSDEFDSLNAKFNLRVLNLNDQNLCKSFFQLLSGVNLNDKPIEVFTEVKKIKPRRN